jgi:hypothetical protein
MKRVHFLASREDYVGMLFIKATQCEIVLPA